MHYQYVNDSPAQRMLSVFYVERPEVFASGVCGGMSLSHHSQFGRKASMIILPQPARHQRSQSRPGH